MSQLSSLKYCLASFRPQKRFQSKTYGLSNCRQLTRNLLLFRRKLNLLADSTGQSATNEGKEKERRYRSCFITDNSCHFAIQFSIGKTIVTDARIVCLTSRGSFSIVHVRNVDSRPEISAQNLVIVSD